MTETLFQKITDLEGEIKGILFCIILGISAYFLDSFLSQNGFFSLGSGTLSFILGVITAQFVSNLGKGGGVDDRKHPSFYDNMPWFWPRYFTIIR